MSNDTGYAMLGIELTNVCNYKCYFCDARKPKETAIISFEKFKEIVDDACELGIKFLKLTPSNGDIFTIPNIVDMLLYIENSSIEKYEFHTNFSLVAPSTQDKLIQLKKSLKIW